MIAAIQKAFAYFQLLSLVPALIEAVRALEGGISGPGQGPLKLKAIIDIIRLIYALVPSDLKKVLRLEEIEAFITSVIGVLVGAFNASGTFKTGGQE